jgi:AcrR family transcriptional regulator
MTTTARPGPRDRLLDAARELTYVHGVGVGVDAILSAADVARRSLYQHFGGKDQLLAEVVRTTADRDVQRYRDALQSGGTDPRARILALFDALHAAVAEPTFRGCRYTAADLGLTDPGHPVHAETRAYKQRLHSLLADEAGQLGHPQPARAADELLLLIDGTLAFAATLPSVRAVEAVRALVEHVLDEAGTAQTPSRQGARAGGHPQAAGGGRTPHAGGANVGEARPPATA